MIHGISDDEWNMAKHLMYALPFVRYIPGLSKQSEVQQFNLRSKGIMFEIIRKDIEAYQRRIGGT